MTLDRLLREGAAVLEEAGVPDARLDAGRLLLTAFGMDEAHFLLNRTQPLPGPPDGGGPDGSRGREEDAGSAARAEDAGGVSREGEPGGAVRAEDAGGVSWEGEPGGAARAEDAGGVSREGEPGGAVHAENAGGASRSEGARVERAAAAYRRMIRRRAEREPLQYILGNQEFMGMDFTVNRHVLVPRQDTETLVELVLREQRGKGKSVLDLCTGSGCIAVSLAALGGWERVTAADLSREALLVAERNARALLPGWRVRRAGPSGREEEAETGKAEQMTGEEERGKAGRVTEGEGTGENERATGGAGARVFELCRGDLFGALPPGERYDVLVSNPPYIPTGEIGGLQPEVRDYEPRLALDGAGDGLMFHRRIAEGAGRWLNPGGAVYLEIGYDQAEAVREILREAGFSGIEIFRDLSGLDRVARAFCPSRDRRGTFGERGRRGAGAAAREERYV